MGQVVRRIKRSIGFGVLISLLAASAVQGGAKKTPLSKSSSPSATKKILKVAQIGSSLLLTLTLWYWMKSYGGPILQAANESSNMVGHVRLQASRLESYLDKLDNITQLFKRWWPFGSGKGDGSS